MLELSNNLGKSPVPSKVQTRFLGLDVVRAVAITLVLFYHLNQNNFFSAGFLGVDIFFSLSGFLITSLLLREHSQEGHIQIGAFYLRRLKRLYPPSVALLLVCAALSPFLSTDSVDRFRKDLPAAVFYISNWWQIYSEQSYFEYFGHPPLLQHLWSLAVEEQFYILWPITLQIFLRLVNVRILGWMCLALAIASTVWMSVIFQFGLDLNDPSRAYLGTDTHAMGLFLGAMLACFWNPWLSRPQAIADWVKRWQVVLASLSLLLLIIMTTLWHEGHPLLFRGGFFLTGLCTLLLIVSLTDLPVDDMPLPLWTQIGVDIVRWIGTRSYSIYLWHWPIFIYFQANPEMSWQTIAACLGITALAAEVCYRLIELPLQGIDLSKSKPYLYRALWGVGLSMIVLLSFSAAGYWLPQTVAPQSPPPLVEDLSGYRFDKYIGSSEPNTINSSPSTQSPKVTRLGTTVSRADDIDPLNKKILVIGDSVMLGASDYIVKHFPETALDAVTGRQAHQGLQVIQKLRQKYPNIEYMVIHLGTNGYIVESQFVQLLKALSDIKHVTVLNVYANRRWTSPNNQIIDRVTRNFDNVHLVDWNQMGQNNPQFFISDGVHPTSAGIIAMSREISRVTGVDLQSLPTHSTSKKGNLIARSVRTKGQGPLPDAPSQELDNFQPSSNAASSVEEVQRNNEPSVAKEPQ